MLGTGDLLGCLMGGTFSNFPVNGQNQEAWSPLQQEEGLSISADRGPGLATLAV